MKDLKEVLTEIKEVCKEHIDMQKKIEALQQAGYENIKYRYLKGSKVLIPSPCSGLFTTTQLPMKGLYRIQVGYTELKKGYPAAWCVEVSSADVEYVEELPF